ncbi:MAG: 1-acyl-sn-glycerol-3-phosphate acyltransferase, partial [Aeromonas veronii]
GMKGRVHVSFGAPITEGFSDPDELAALIDKAIWSSYHLFPSNYLAADVSGKANTIEQAAFLTRQSEVPEEHKAIWRAMYAKPVENAKKA